MGAKNSCGSAALDGPKCFLRSVPPLSACGKSSELRPTRYSATETPTPTPSAPPALRHCHISRVSFATRETLLQIHPHLTAQSTMAQQQIQFSETIRAMKLAMKRRPDDADSDDSIQANTNRGNKLKRKAGYVQHGQLNHSGSLAYKKVKPRSSHSRTRS